MGKSVSLYLDDESLAAIAALAEAEDRANSWAARVLIKRGAGVVEVPKVAGGIEGWRAMVDLEKGGGK